MKTNKNTIIPSVLAFMLMVNFAINSAYACTGIRLTATDKKVVYGRSMEWGAFDLNSRIAIIPRGFTFTGLTPEGVNGKVWKTKYGFVGLDQIGKDFYADGINEEGLAVGFFYHPLTANYNPFEKDKIEQTITAVDVTGYILSNFATIDEVKIGMNNVRVVGVIEEALGIQVDSHWMVTSAKGNSIVIEYIDGKLKIYDNPLGVITNSPSFDWHMTNLRNYIGLTAAANPAKTLNNIELKAIGGGSGMFGLPGDFTPVSRFIRAVAWSQTARPTPTSSETVYELFRILDNFNLPLGSAEGSDGHAKTKELRSATLWTTAWDLSNLVLYYHTMHNRRVRALDLKLIDFSALDSNKIVRLPLDKKKTQDIEYLMLEK